MAVGNKYLERPFSLADSRVIVEEVRFLVEGGYRGSDKEQILEGLDVALKGLSREDWKRWNHMLLRDVIDDLYYLGTP